MEEEEEEEWGGKRLSCDHICLYMLNKYSYACSQVSSRNKINHFCNSVILVWNALPQCHFLKTSIITDHLLQINECENGLRWKEKISCLNWLSHSSLWLPIQKSTKFRNRTHMIFLKTDDFKFLFDCYLFSLELRQMRGVDGILKLIFLAWILC